MRRTTALLATLLLTATTALAADEKPEEKFHTVREYRTRVFEIRHGDPRTLYSALSLLGSGFQGAAMSFNEELGTITVRDFPENIATLDEAIQRLDQPAPAPPDIELRITVLIGAETPLEGALVPEDLAPVVRQLQSTLRYSHYGLMTATLHRTRAGRGIDGSGVADAALLGMKPSQERPILYKYRLREISVASAAIPPAVDIEDFDFSMNVPVATGGDLIQYTSVGFHTPVSIGQNEKVVIGTTTMGDRALIVVVTATLDAPSPAR